MTPPNHVGDLSIPWFSYYYPQKPKSPFSHLVRKPQLADLRHMGQLALSCLQYAAQFLSQHAGEPWGMWPGGFHKWGIPNSWMVYFMEYHIKMDDLGVPSNFRNPQFWPVPMLPPCLLIVSIATMLHLPADLHAVCLGKVLEFGFRLLSIPNNCGNSRHDQVWGLR